MLLHLLAAMTKKCDENLKAYKERERVLNRKSMTPDSTAKALPDRSAPARTRRVVASAIVVLLVVARGNQSCLALEVSCPLLAFLEPRLVHAAVRRRSPSTRRRAHLEDSASLLLRPPLRHSALLRNACRTPRTFRSPRPGCWSTPLTSRRWTWSSTIRICWSSQRRFGIENVPAMLATSDHGSKTCGFGASAAIDLSLTLED